METDNRMAEVPKHDISAQRKPWQAPAVEVLPISETQNHSKSGFDINSKS
jgi:hypothetical protein